MPTPHMRAHKLARDVSYHLRKFCEYVVKYPTNIHVSYYI
jgi:hypothetical protein